VLPYVDFLKKQQDIMKERYLEAIFLPPVLADDNLREEMLKAMRARIPYTMGSQTSRTGLCISLPRIILSSFNLPAETTTIIDL
jgi:hypothetical protein